MFTELLSQLSIMYIGAFVVAVLVSSSMAENPRDWWRFVFGVTMFSLLINFKESLQADLLIRDVVAWLFLAGGTPLLIAPLGRLKQAAWIRTGLALSAVGVLAALTPIILLLVHCTSGDCL